MNPTRRPLTTAQPTSSPSIERAEEAGERFEEACDHARQLDDFQRLQLGPTIPLPMSQVAPGVLAWKRSLVDPSVKSTGELHYVIRPGPASRSSPFSDEPLAHFALQLTCRGPPRSSLFLRASSSPASARLTAFAKRVCRNLESESD